MFCFIHYLNMVRAELLHVEFQEFLALKIAFYVVVYVHLPHSGRRSGEDEVAGLQRKELADVAHQLVYVVKHVSGVSLLHRVAIDAEVEMEILYAAETEYPLLISSGS